MCELERNGADTDEPDEPLAQFACPVVNGTISCEDEEALDGLPADVQDKVLAFLAAWPAGPAVIKPLAAGGPPPA